LLYERWGVVEARRWLAALAAWLRRHDGVPPDAVASVRASLTTYCLLYGGVYVEYTLRDDPRRPRGWWDLLRHLAGWRRGFRRRVVFTGFELPGYPATPEPLPC
jgi:hypothetical protein